MSTTHPLVAFYDGTGVDGAGRALAEVHAFSLDRLEDEHDYIQWLFPMRERSPVNPHAPVVDETVISEFSTRPDLREALRRSLEMMLRFYGFVGHAAADDYRVTEGPDFPARAAVWLTRGNHNFLRLTRILRSLSLLGERDRAMALFGALADVYERRSGIIGERTFEFWKAAVNG